MFVIYTKTIKKSEFLLMCVNNNSVEEIILLSFFRQKFSKECEKFWQMFKENEIFVEQWNL